MEVKINLEEYQLLQLINTLRPLQFKFREKILEPLEDAYLTEWGRRIVNNYKKPKDAPRCLCRNCKTQEND